MQGLATYIFCVMVGAAPLHLRPKYKNPEVREDMGVALERYRSISSDLASVVWSGNSLFPNDRYKRKTALLMLAVAYHESGFHRNVDFGIGKGVGDRGRSFCLMQINVGKGKTPQGWTSSDLVSDRKKCFTVALDLLSKLKGTCKGNGGMLTSYLSGGCHAGAKQAKKRWNTFYTWAFRYPRIKSMSLVANQEG